jgi:hypothetical protein
MGHPGPTFRRRAGGRAVAGRVVSKGWTLETMFQSLTTMFQGELATPGYPQAALFGFA